MTKFVVCVLCLLAFGLSPATTNAFEHARHKSTRAKPARDLAQKLTCKAATKKYPKFASSDCIPTGAESTAAEAGRAYISVVDEADEALSGFCVRIDGKIMGRTKVPAFSLDKGKKIIEVRHDDVGEGCQEVEIKAGEMSKIAFQFFRLREKVTPVTAAVFERQYQGAIVVLNGFGDQAEVFVDPKRPRETYDLDDRLSKGRGSLDISNLAPDTYVVELRPKNDATPLKCGGQPCSIEVKLDKCKSVTVEAGSDRVVQQRPVSKPCREAQKDERPKKSAAATKRRQPARADRHFWR